jgi:hypothetical protein
MRADVGFFRIENVGSYQAGAGATCYQRPYNTILHFYDIAKELLNNRLLFKQFSSVVFGE